MIPAMFCVCASISALRSPGPASRDPKTTRAFCSVASFSVFGSDSGGGSVGAVRVAGCTFRRGCERSSKSLLTIHYRTW
jgi:hypothetical protein